MHRRIEDMDEGGNAHKGPGEEKLGALGEIGTADVRGWYPNGGSRMDNNGPHPEREGGGVGVSNLSRWRGMFAQQW